VSGQLISRFGRYHYLAVGGSVIATFGMFLLANMNATTDYPTVLRNMIIIGFGLGPTLPVFTLAVQNAVEQRIVGTATSTVQFFRSMGGALGAAVFGSVLSNRFAPSLHDALPPSVAASLTPEQFAAIANPQALLNPDSAGALQQGGFVDAIRVALAGSLHDVFLAATAVLVVTTLVVLFLKDIPLRGYRGPGRVQLREVSTEASIGL
jgi:MFS family permease